MIPGRTRLPESERRGLRRGDACVAPTRRKCTSGRGMRGAPKTPALFRGPPARCYESERRMMTKQAIWLRLGLVLFATTALCGAVFAQNAVEEFYRGRQINLIIGYGPGGGYDMVGRLLARHLGRYLPGHPTIVAQNLPGAGSLRAVNYLYSVAPRDGTTFGLFGSDMALIGLIGANSNIQFDPRKFTWLGSSSSFAGDAYVLMVRPGAHVKSIAAARRANGPPLVLAGTGEGARDADVPKILRDALALNIKQVLGY